MHPTDTLHAREALNYDPHVPRKLTSLLLLTMLAAFPAHASWQTNPQHPQPKPARDQLGMACAQILQMSSADWIAKAASADASAADAQLHAIASYGRCYDGRTDRLAALLAKTGKGPSTGARADFRDFEASIADFTAKALAPANDPVKTAYAALYEKQFRYAFYQEYEMKSASAAAAKKPAAPPAAPQPKTDAQAPSSSRSQAEPKDLDPMTLAKNRFGELLRVMPDDRLHEIHEAFGEILGPHSASPAMQLAVYRYAIFVLEPPSPTSFAPPPF